MNGKSIFGAIAIAIGTFIGAGTLAQLTNDAKHSTNALASNAEAVGDATGAQTKQLAELAKETAETIATKAEHVARQAKDAAGDRIDAAGATIQVAANLKKAGARQTARFVELKLNAKEPQILAGRAPQGSTVEAIVDGKIVGTAITSRAGIWKMAIDPPIASTAYILSLQSTPADGSTPLPIAGQAADVTVDAAGRARIAIKPAPEQPKAIANADTEDAGAQSKTASKAPAIPERNVAAVDATQSEAPSNTGTDPKSTSTKGTSTPASDASATTDAGTKKTDKPAKSQEDSEDSKSTSKTAETDNGAAKTKNSDTADAKSDASSNVADATDANANAGTSAAKQTTGDENGQSADDTDAGVTKPVETAKKVESEPSVQPADEKAPAANTAEKQVASGNDASATDTAKSAQVDSAKSDDGTTPAPSTAESAPESTADEEPGLLDGLIDQASKIAEAATEKFSDVLGTGDATKPDTTNTPESTDTEKDTATTSTSNPSTASAAPLEIAGTKVTTTEAGDTILELSGTGKPGSKLGIYVDEKRVAGTTAAADGSWSLKHAVELKGKPADLKVAQYDAAGAIANSQTRTIQPVKRKKNAVAVATNEGTQPDQAKSDEAKSAPESTPSREAAEAPGDGQAQSETIIASPTQKPQAPAAANKSRKKTHKAGNRKKRARKAKSRKRRVTRAKRRKIKRARRAYKAKRLRKRRRSATRAPKRVHPSKKRRAAIVKRVRSIYVRDRHSGPWVEVRIIRLKRSGAKWRERYTRQRRIRRYRSTKRTRYFRRLQH